MILGGGFVLLFVFERIFPLRVCKGKFVHRLGVNICLSVLGFLIGRHVVRRVGLAMCGYVVDTPFGLLQWFALGEWVKMVVGIGLMDFSFYYWHRANHAFDILWRFHSVHHIDPDMDITTSFRFHFGEVLYSTFFRVVQVGLFGIGPATYVIYEVIFQLATMFHHSNVRLPERVGRVVNMIFVTPRMHGVHHSIVKKEVNSNYSVVFRFWDVFNRTLNLKVEQSEIVIGVIGKQEAKDNGLWRLIVSPFVRMGTKK